MRTVSDTLAAAQTARSRTPYFHCVFTEKAAGAATFDCSGIDSRILKIRHVEVPYVGNFAEITLDNYDRGVPSLRGYYVEIGYGDVTGTLTNGTGTVTDMEGRASPVQLTQLNNLVKVTTGGTFTIVLPTGGSGTATSGTGTVTGSPAALVAGSNSITATAGTITIATVGCYEYSATARLEVRYQTVQSIPGRVTTVVYLIGSPDRMNELLVQLGTAPDWYKLYNRDTTIFNILSALFTAGGLTLNAIPKEPAAGTNTADAGTDATTLVDAALTGTTDDYYKDWYVYNTTRSAGATISASSGAGKSCTHATIANQVSGDTYYIVKADEIISAFKPFFEINADNTLAQTYSFETIQAAYYRLIMMTKCYLRERASLAFDVIYPRSVDAIDLTINSSTVPWFYEYHHKQNEVIPNAVYVYANRATNDEVTPWASMITGASKDDDAIARNNAVEIPDFLFAATLLTQADADDRASAILTRIKAEVFSAGVVIPHDCRIELYDNDTVSDTRGY